MDPNEVLAYLNELGYRNVSASQLKEFLIDLKKLMKYVNERDLNEEQFEQYLKNSTEKSSPRDSTEQEHIEVPAYNNNLYASKQHKESSVSFDNHNRLFNQSQNQKNGSISQLYLGEVSDSDIQNIKRYNNQPHINNSGQRSGGNPGQRISNHSQRYNAQLQMNDLAQRYDSAGLTNDKFSQRYSNRGLRNENASQRYTNQRTVNDNLPQRRSMQVDDVPSARMNTHHVYGAPQRYENQAHRSSSNRQMYDGQNELYANPKQKYGQNPLFNKKPQTQRYDDQMYAEYNSYQVQSQFDQLPNSYSHSNQISNDDPNPGPSYVNRGPQYNNPPYNHERIRDSNDDYDEQDEDIDEDDMESTTFYNINATKHNNNGRDQQNFHHNLHETDTIATRNKRKEQMQYQRQQKPISPIQSNYPKSYDKDTNDVGIQYIEIPTTTSTQTFSCDEKGIQYYLNKPNKICGMKCPDRPNTEIKMIQSSTSKNHCVKFKNENKCMQCTNSDISSNQLKCFSSNVISKPPITKKPQPPCICPPKKKEAELKPTSSFIRPRLNLKPAKSDPVALYHMYQEEWKRNKIPGKDSHMDLRWAIRSKMMGGGDNYGAIM